MDYQTLARQVTTSLEKALEETINGEYSEDQLKRILDVLEPSKKNEEVQEEEYSFDIIKYLFRGWYLTTLLEGNGNHTEVE